MGTMKICSLVLLNLQKIKLEIISWASLVELLMICLWCSRWISTTKISKTKFINSMHLLKLFQILLLLLKKQGSEMRKKFYLLLLKRFWEEKKAKRILILLTLMMHFNIKKSWSKKVERPHISTSSLISMQMNRFKKSYLSSATISSLPRIYGSKKILQ